MHCNTCECKFTIMKKKKKREKYYIHPPISNRNVTRKNNGPEYIRLEILHSVHYTRKKTQNSDDANTRRYSLSSLPPSLPPPLRLVSFSLVENRIYDVYMLALFRVMHIGATRHRASLHHYLRLKSIPFLSFRWRDRSVDRSVAPRPNLLRLQPPFRPRAKLQTRFAGRRAVNIERDRRNLVTRLELSAWQTIFLPLMRRESTDHLCNYSKWRERMWREMVWM